MAELLLTRRSHNFRMLRFCTNPSRCTAAGGVSQESSSWKCFTVCLEGGLLQVAQGSFDKQGQMTKWRDFQHVSICNNENWFQQFSLTTQSPLMSVDAFTTQTRIYTGSSLLPPSGQNYVSSYLLFFSFSFRRSTFAFIGRAIYQVNHFYRI